MIRFRMSFSAAASSSGRNACVRRALTNLLIACTLACAHSALAQDGYFDPAWGDGGRLLVDVSIGEDEGSTILLQPDGKLLILGICKDVDTGHFCATRLRQNGSNDFGFGPGAAGYALYDTLSGFVSDGALLSSGSILLAGNYDSYGVPPTIARLTPAGLIDVGAGNGHGFFQFHYYTPNEPGGSGPNSTIDAIAVQADGKILVAGRAQTWRAGISNNDFAIARLLPDLSGLDPSFGGGDGLSPPGVKLIPFDRGGPSGDNNDLAYALLNLRDGRILVGGVVGVTGTAFGRTDLGLARLQANGQLDTSFGDGGRVVLSPASGSDSKLTALAGDRQGRVVIAGYTRGVADRDFLVARILADGQLDPDFGTQGFQTIDFNLGDPPNDYANDVVVQSDGGIIVAGRAQANPSPTQYREKFALARLLDNGVLDPSFGSGGKSIGNFSPPSQPTGYSASVSGIAIGNGGLMVVGSGIASGGDERFGIAKLSLDLVFGSGFEP